MPLSIFLFLGSFESLIYVEKMIFWSHYGDIFLNRDTTVNGCDRESSLLTDSLLADLLLADFFKVLIPRFSR